MFSLTASAAPTLRALSSVLTSIKNWHLLGVHLGLQGHHLREIERIHHGDTDRCQTKMLDFWLQNARNPTWEAVAKALELMQEHALADVIRKKYCSSSYVIGNDPSRKVYLLNLGRNV